VECASLKMKFHKDVAATLDGWALEGTFTNSIALTLVAVIVFVSQILISSFL